VSAALCHGAGLSIALRRLRAPAAGRVFAHHVADPAAYDVVEFGGSGRVLSIEEKPDRPKSS
jgi:glucose-1-phosphate thymidylyltransferase